MNKLILSVPFADYSIYKGNLNDLSYDNKIVINTINQYSFCIAEEDHYFKKALQSSDILLPDGVAVVVAIRILTGQKIKKIAGADIHFHLLQELERKSGSCFYLGSSENTLLKIKDRISVEFPNIRVGSFSPPYLSEFTNDHNLMMIEMVNAFQPDVLFIGMTAPKQEKWANLNKDYLNSRIICSIGAVFDFYAGTVPRPSNFWVKLHLEWFIRLLKEPKRMWKRYLYYGPIYVGYIFKKIFQRGFF
jgi:N-acetylglucosaminyldiphosphoundecaprenol N-acetyl-beta-D-mannosaminyltransferase